PSRLSANPSVASLKSMNELAPTPIVVPAGMRYFRVLPSVSVRYHPPIFTGEPLVFLSSIHVPPAGALELTSLTTTEPAAKACSVIPGVPRICLLARHATGVFQFA